MCEHVPAHIVGRHRRDRMNLDRAFFSHEHDWKIFPRGPLIATKPRDPRLRAALVKLERLDFVLPAAKIRIAPLDVVSVRAREVRGRERGTHHLDAKPEAPRELVLVRERFGKKKTRIEEDDGPLAREL